MFNKKYEKLSFQLDSIYEDFDEELESVYKEVKQLKDMTKIVNVGEKLGEIKLGIQKLQSNNPKDIQDAKSDIIQRLTSTYSLLLSAYEDISKIPKAIEDMKKILDSERQTIVNTNTNVTSSASKSIANLDSTLNIVKNKIDEYKDAVETKAKYEELQKGYAKLVCINAKLNDENEKLSDINKSLEASFAMVCQGLYNQDNIEFAAVKTYREGWRYLCYNGRQLTNFDDIDNLQIQYYKGERLRVDLVFDGN